MPSDIQAILWDLDGVIADTEDLYTAFWAEMDALYPTGEPRFTQVIKGHILDWILSAYFPDPDHQTDIVRRLIDYEAAMPYRLYPGVLALMKNAHARGLRNVIVTSSSQRKLDTLLGQNPALRPLIDAMVTDSDVTHGKPHPEPYLVGAEKADATPSRCLVMEDSLSGLESGRAAGARTLAVATGHTVEELRQHADMVFAALAEINLDDVLGVINA